MSPSCIEFAGNIDWSCMLPSQEAGCGIMCQSCDGLAGLGEAGTITHSWRWLRPSATKESRTATGVWVFPSSGDPREQVILFPLNSGNMELAQCWTNFGGEDFTKDICGCHAGRNICSATAGRNYLVASNSSEGDDWMATCWYFAGWGWPPQLMRCTGELTQSAPFAVQFTSSGLGNASLIHLGTTNAPAAVSNTCTPNAAVRCYGHQENGPSGCTTSGFNPQDYYNQEGGGGQWQSFDFLRVNSIAATFKGTRPEDRLRNLTMAFVEADRALGFNGQLNFDQLDSCRRSAGLAVGCNSGLAWFERTYNLGETETQTTEVSFTDFSGRIQPFGVDIYPPGSPYEYTITANVPDEARTDITMDFTAVLQQLAGAFQVTVYINDTFVGIIFRNNQSCVQSVDTITINQATWNQLVNNNSIKVTLEPRGIQSTACAESWIETTISYTGVKIQVFEGAIPLANLQAIAPLTGRLRKSGYEINGEYILVDAKMQANVILHRVNTADPLGIDFIQDNTVFPLVTVRIKLHMGVRISAPDVTAFNAAGHTLEGSVLNLRNGVAFGGDNFPSVVNDVDEIEWYDDQGDYVRPPSRIVWRGHLGYTSDPQTGPIGAGTCLAVFASFPGRQIGAHASHIEGNPGERHLVWGGGITIAYSG